MGCGEMPSEVIYGPDNVQVRVSWGTGEQGNVQVVSQAVAAVGMTDTQPFERLIGIVNEWLKEAGEPTIDPAKLREVLPYEPSFDGWWAQLDDWAQVNRLIKALKRARDRQFGSPE